MADRYFPPGTSISITSTDLKNYTFSGTFLGAGTGWTGGSFRSTGDIDSDLRLSFTFPTPIPIQWAQSEVGGYFGNFTTAISGGDIPVSIVGALDSDEAEIELSGEGEKYSVKMGSKRQIVSSEVSDPRGFDKRFFINIGANVLPDSYIGKRTISTKYFAHYPDLLLEVPLGNAGGGTTRVTFTGQDIVATWETENLTDGMIDLYMKELPLSAFPDIGAAVSNTLLIRSDDATAFGTTITDAGGGTNCPHTITANESYHKQVGALFGSSHLSANSLTVTHHADFDLVGQEFDWNWYFKTGKVTEKVVFFEKGESYRAEGEFVDDTLHVNFYIYKDKSDVNNCWLEPPVNNTSGYLSVPYSGYFLRGSNQGSNDKWTLDFLAAPISATDQPIYRQLNDAGDDGDFHVTISSTVVKIKYGQTGAVAEDSFVYTPTAVDDFHHYGLVRNTDGTIDVYVNGTSVGTTAALSLAATDMAGVEIGHAMMGNDNATEMWMTEAKLSWVRFTNGDARWSGQFSPPATPEVGVTTVLTINFDSPGKAFTDLSPHAHVITNEETLLRTAQKDYLLISGECSPLSDFSRWNHIRIQRDLNGVAKVLCNNYNITTIANNAPDDWLNSTLDLVLAPTPNNESPRSISLEEFRKEDVITDTPICVLDSADDLSGRLESKTSETVKTNNYTVTEKVGTPTMTASSDDSSNTPDLLVDVDTGTRWNQNTTQETVENGPSDIYRTGKVIGTFTEMVPCEQIDITVPAGQGTLYPERIQISAKNPDGGKLPLNDTDGLSWTDGETKSFLLSAERGVDVAEGVLGERSYGSVFPFVDSNGDSCVGIIGGANNDDFVSYSTVTGKWTTHTATHAKAGAMGCFYEDSGSTQKVVLWGGDTSDQDVYELDINADTVSAAITTTGTKPTAREKYSAVFYLKGAVRTLAVWGGHTGVNSLQEFKELDLESAVWSAPSTSGTEPAAKQDATVWFFKDGSSDPIMAIFGGHNDATEVNEYHELNLTSGVWTARSLTGTPPTARRGATGSMSYVNSSGDTILCLYGGHDGSNYLNDYHELNASTGVWSGEITVSGNDPVGVQGARGVLVKESSEKIKMMILGGYNTLWNDTSSYVSHHPILNVTDQSWDDVYPASLNKPFQSNMKYSKVGAEKKPYFVWSHNKRTVAGLDPVTGQIVHLNTDINDQAWNTAYTEESGTEIYSSSGDDILIFVGGYDDNNTANTHADVHELNLTTGVWSAPSITGTIAVRFEPVLAHYVDRSGDDQLVVYGGRDSSGLQIKEYHRLALGTYTYTNDVALTKAYGSAQIFDPSFRRGVVYDREEEPTLVLFALSGLDDDIDFCEVDLREDTYRSRMGSGDSPYTHSWDAHTVYKNEKGETVLALLTDISASVKYRELNLTTRTFSGVIEEGVISTGTFWVGVTLPSTDGADQPLFFRTDDITDAVYEYNPLLEGVSAGWTRTFRNITSTVYEIESGRQDDNGLSLAELTFKTKSSLIPDLSFDPANETTLGLAARSASLMVGCHSTAFSPTFDTITDSETVRVAKTQCFIPTHNENGFISVDNTGYPGRKALITADVGSGWSGTHYELLDQSDTALDYGYQQSDLTVSGVQTSNIVFWADLAGNSLNFFRVASSTTSSFLTTADVYEVVPAGESDNWSTRHPAVSYLPSCTVGEGGMIRDSITVDGTYVVEINFAGGISPNFCVINTDFVAFLGEELLHIEGWDTGDTEWDYLGSLDTSSQEGTYSARIFCGPTTYSKFRLVLPDSSPGTVLSGFTFFTLNNAAVKSSGEVVSTDKRLWEVLTDPAGEAISEYTGTTPTILGGSKVTIPTAPDTYLRYPAIVGDYVYSATDPSGYPYYVRITTTDNTQILADFTAVLGVDILADTGAKFAFSFDGRTTWYTWSGGTWSVVDISTDVLFNSNGMTAAEVRGIDEEDWDVYIGTGSNTIDVAILLKVSADTDQAYFDNITFMTEGGSAPTVIFNTSDKTVAASMGEATTLNIRNATEVTGASAVRAARGGIVTAGLTTDQLSLWAPTESSYLQRISSREGVLDRPGWVSVKGDAPNTRPFLGLGWFSERSTIKKVDLSNSTSKFILDGNPSYVGVSEGGISFSDGNLGYTVGNDDTGASSVGFLDVFDYTTETKSRLGATTAPYYSRGVAATDTTALFPPMDGSVKMQQFSLTNGTQIEESRVSATSNGWGDNGAVTDMTTGWFFTNPGVQLSMYSYDFTSGTSVVTKRQDLSATYTNIKGVSYPTGDRASLLTNTGSLSIRNIQVEFLYSNDTTYVTSLEVSPSYKSVSSASSTELDSCTSKVADDQTAVGFIYTETDSVLTDSCKALDFETGTWSYNSRLDGSMGSTRSGFASAGMSGSGQMI